MEPVHPKEWILPNRIYFNKWVYREFHPSKYPREAKEKGFDPDPSQKLVRDFLHYESPYRGLLLYHALGTGKSCSSILSTESFISHKKKVIVLTPASLENNYRKELKKCSLTGGLLRKKWMQVQLQLSTDQEHVQSLKKMMGITKDFIEKQKGLLWLPMVPKELPKDRIVKAATLIRTLPEEQKQAVQKVYEHIVDQRYLFLHYNGLTNKKMDELEKKDDFNKDIFDDTIVVIDEVHTFISRVVNGGKIARRMYNILISKPNLKLVLLSGTPVINHPFELCYTLNLLRGPIVEYSLSMLKDTPLPSQKELEDVLAKEKLIPFIDDLRLDEGQQQIKITLLPSGFMRKDPSSIEVVQGPKIYDPKAWMDRLVSKLKKSFKLSTRVKVEEYNALPDRREDFFELFFDTTDPENPKIKKDVYELFLKRISGVVSYVRIADEGLFPKQFPIEYEKVPMSNTQFTHYVEVRNTEIKKDELQKKRQARRKEGVDMFKTNSSYRAFSRMACNYVFPEKIKRPFPSEIHARFLKREMDIQEEDEAQSKEEKEKEGVQVMKEYDKELQAALDTLKAQAATYLQGKGLYESSPKMAKLIELLSAKTEKALLYSQFRTVEGLRIFRMVLDQAGWKEIDFKSKAGGDWEIVNADEVLKPEYNGKRYLLFGDKNKTDLLIGLFNADRQVLPLTVQAQLEAAGLTENLRGNLASLLMITQSGAEGLNLRNVRHVYIMEPFWNEVRINQVIGRAVRKGSHLELPEEERNVKVTMFLTTFTKTQAKANKTIQFKDNGLTTDENVRELALKKDRIIQQFLRLVQSNAMDCVFNATNNKPLQNQYSCFAYPINQGAEFFSYIPNLKEDQKLSSFGIRERSRKIKGKVYLKDNRKVVQLDGDAKFYDYQAYKDAGVLIEAL